MAWPRPRRISGGFPHFRPQTLAPGAFPVYPRRPAAGPPNLTHLLMIKWILQKIVGSKNQRELRRIRPTVVRINHLEEALQQEPPEKLVEMTRKWQAHLARYHYLEAPAKPLVERMNEDDLRATAALIELRLNVLREEFPSLPAMVEPTPAAIEAAKNAFHDVSLEFRTSRAKYLESILPEAYAVVKNAARRL